MPSIWRSGLTWTGFTGAPGRTTLYAMQTDSSAQAFANDAYSLLRNIHAPSGTVTNLPQNVRITQDGYVDEIDVVTGDLVSRVGVTPGASYTGLNTQAWSSPSGFCITWTTSAFIGGRRLTGRTFFVPASGNFYDTDGTLAGAQLTTIGGAVTSYINGTSTPVVWHRPVPGIGGGAAHAIIAGSTADKVSILTSRRD